VISSQSYPRFEPGQTILVAVLGPDDKPVWVTRLSGSMEVYTESDDYEIYSDFSDTPVTAFRSAYRVKLTIEGTPRDI
jgi:hypothetical protein